MSVLRCPLGHMVERPAPGELPSRRRRCQYCGCHYDFSQEAIDEAEGESK